MRRTLYLRANSGVDLTVDGPSLWVKEKDRSGYRVPARLIARVVIYGDFVLPAGFMALFASRGVPVCFQTLGGQPLYTALPRQAYAGRVNTMFQAGLEAEDVRAELESGIRSRRSHLLLGWLGQLRHPLHERFRLQGICEAAYAEAMNRRLGGQSVRDALHRTFMPMLVDEAVTIIRRAGFDVHRGVRGCDGPFSLAEDIGWMLVAEVDRLADGFRVRHGRPKGNPAGYLQNAVAVYEKRRRVLVSLILEAVDHMKTVVMKGET